MSVYVVRAFVQLREMLASNKELARRFAQLETRLNRKLTTHDEAAPRLPLDRTAQISAETLLVRCVEATPA
jgi:hypothetical protein